MKRAYHLYKNYKTTSNEFKSIAASMSLSLNELISRCWSIHQQRAA